jgi:hypothetical protein
MLLTPGQAFAYDYTSRLYLTARFSSPITALNFNNNQVFYSSLGNLYINDSPVDLLNSFSADSPGLQIYEIQISGEDFYLATELGFFKNQERIFQKEPVYKSVITDGRIYISGQNGIYVTEVHEENPDLYAWRLIPNSPPMVNFFTMNKSGSDIEFASSDYAFYYHKGKQWINRSAGISRDLAGSFNFGRFSIIRKENDQSYILLPSSSGFYLSADRGQTWVESSGGLKSNPDGLYNLREVTIDPYYKADKNQDHHLLLISDNGIYSGDLDTDQLKSTWRLINIQNSAKNANYSDDFYDIYADNQIIFICNSQGQIFELSGSDEYIENKPIPLAKRILEGEPSIQETHRQALLFAGIPTGKKFDKYKFQARIRHIIPDLEAFVDKDARNLISLETAGSDNFNSNTSSITNSYDATNFNSNDDKINAGIKLVWKLSNLIYDPDINDINTSARVTANIRENILTEITQIYFARKALLQRLLGETPKTAISDKLKLNEYTAQLDARTGAWFSAELERRINPVLSQFDRTFAEHIKELYFGS